MNTTDQPVTATTGVGGGKFVGIGIFCFTCLGIALLYPYNAIISATDWFEYAMPQSDNIAGGLANANFIASLVSKTYYASILLIVVVDSSNISCVTS